MRIAPPIITLLALVSLATKSYSQEPISSSNVEPYRSSVVPYSTALGVEDEDVTSLRYALPIEDWTEQSGINGVSYNTTFEAPFSWGGRQAIISIGSVSAPYVLYVGGEEVGRTLNGGATAQFNITRYLEREGSTALKISLLEESSSKELESWSDSRSTPYLGEVMMLSQPPMYIRDVAVTSTYSYGMLNTTFAIAVKSESLNERTSRINYELLSPNGRVATSGTMDITLDMRREDTLRVFVVTPDSLAWSPESPNLYRLKLSTQYRGRHLEHLTFDVGLRSIEPSNSGELIVNGSKAELKAAVVEPNTTIERVAELKERGYNTLRLSAGAYNPEIVRYSDSVGLFVVTTAPINSSKSGDDICVGGNPTNDPKRHEEYIERVDAHYHTTKLHPSIIAYSIAEESLNGINLYESYLHLKALESQRPIIYEQSNGEWNSDKLNIDY